MKEKIQYVVTSQMWKDYKAREMNERKEKRMKKAKRIKNNIEETTGKKIKEKYKVI
jgi:hypothetical protein